MTRLKLLPISITLLNLIGCETRQPTSVPSAPKSAQISSPQPSKTVDRVRRIVSEQMGVLPEKVLATTSLGDLGADELDFVELILELEESFSISIPDQEIDSLVGEKDWKKGVNNITVQTLANLVEHLSRKT